MLIQHYRCDKCKSQITEGDHVSISLPRLSTVDLCPACAAALNDVIRETVKLLGATLMERTVVRREAVEELHDHTAQYSGDRGYFVVRPEYAQNYVYKKEFLKFENITFASWRHLFTHLYQTEHDRDDAVFSRFVDDLEQFFEGAKILEDDNEYKNTD